LVWEEKINASTDLFYLTL